MVYYTGIPDDNSCMHQGNNQKKKWAGSHGASFVCNAVHASFYPVFDGITGMDDTFELNIEMYSKHGTFGNLTKSSVSLGDYFADGTIVSVEKETDTVARLIIKVPSNACVSEYSKRLHGGSGKDDFALAGWNPAIFSDAVGISMRNEYDDMNTWSWSHFGWSDASISYVLFWDGHASTEKTWDSYESKYTKNVVFFHFH